MKILKTKFLWFLFSSTASGFVAYTAFNNPMRFVPFTDLLATIISILIGISLAILAILSTRPQISENHYKSAEEKDRMERILKSDNIKLHDGQLILFWFYYASLILAVLLKFLGIYEGEEEASTDLLLKIVSGAFAFIACLSLLWSATLPSFLKSINIQRISLE